MLRPHARPRAHVGLIPGHVGDVGWFGGWARPSVVVDVVAVRVAIVKIIVLLGGV